MRFIETTQSKIINGMAAQFSERTGMPMEEAYRMADRAWDEAVAAGRVNRIETAFGTITLLARSWMPDGVALIVKP
jgi:hypothetical protein